MKGFGGAALFCIVGFGNEPIISLPCSTFTREFNISGKCYIVTKMLRNIEGCGLKNSDVTFSC